MAAPVVGAARGKRRPPLAEINVTPLVDVMLVLLIISMVAAPMLQEGIPLELPKSESASPIEKTDLVDEKRLDLAEIEGPCRCRSSVRRHRDYPSALISVRQARNMARCCTSTVPLLMVSPRSSVWSVSVPRANHTQSEPCVLRPSWQRLKHSRSSV